MSKAKAAAVTDEQVTQNEPDAGTLEDASLLDQINAGPVVNPFPGFVPIPPDGNVPPGPLEMYRHQKRFAALVQLVMFGAGQMLDNAPTPAVRAELLRNMPWTGLLSAAASLEFTLSSETN